MRARFQSPLDVIPQQIRDFMLLQVCLRHWSCTAGQELRTKSAAVAAAIHAGR